MISAKTIFISDLHIGSNACKAEQLLQFLKTIQCDKLILNGDIIDGWRLKRKWFFPQSHLLLIQKLLNLSKHGLDIIFISGNHDEFLRKFSDYDLNIGNIQIVNKYIHTINDKRFLVVHGDAFDVITKYHSWIAKFGDHAYQFSVWLNNHFNNVRFLLGMKYWSLSKYLKNTVKGAVKFIFAFEQAAVDSAKHMGYSGICVGHIHHPSLYQQNGTVYANSGDWCESCSWIQETKDGKLQIWEWNDGSPKLLQELLI